MTVETGSDRSGLAPGDLDGFGRFALLEESDTGLVCHECGEAHHFLARHLAAHQFTGDQYRARHGLGREVKLVSAAMSAKLSASWNKSASDMAKARAASAKTNRGRALTKEEKTLLKRCAPGQQWADQARLILEDTTITIESFSRSVGMFGNAVKRQLRRHPPTEGPAWVPRRTNRQGRFLTADEKAVFERCSTYEEWADHVRSVLEDPTVTIASLAESLGTGRGTVQNRLRRHPPGTGRTSPIRVRRPVHGRPLTEEEKDGFERCLTYGQWADHAIYLLEDPTVTPGSIASSLNMSDAMVRGRLNRRGDSAVPIRIRSKGRPLTEKEKADSPTTAYS